MSFFCRFTAYSNEHVTEDTLSPQIVDSSLLFETGRDRSAIRYVHGSEISNTKMEEKVSKVKIVENKNIILSDLTVSESFNEEENIL